MSVGTVKKAVVIPCYKVGDSIVDVIAAVPAMIEHIIVVDDKCPQGSGRIAQEANDPRVTVLFHEANRGVGGAVLSGYRQALELDCDIVVKMDGDGQMDPAYLEALMAPLLSDEADYTKGNRFTDFQALRSMPKTRLLGNNLLSFFEKTFSGYWDVMDPTNGYTAIHKRVLGKLELGKIARGYFFESSMLLHLNLINAVVKDVPIPARYGDENSSLSIRKAILCFPLSLLGGFIKRVFLKYFIYDFNMASVYMVLGVPLFLWGLIFGVVHWIDSWVTGVPKTAGTIMVAALPLIIAFEMLLQAIHIDISSVPKRKK